MAAPAEKTPMRIGVVGGGIGGLVAALSLHHHCGSRVSIDIYEQACEYREIGAGVGIGLNAAKLLDKIGLGRQVTDISGDRNGVWISFRRYDSDGEIITLPAATDNKMQQCSVHRADFLKILLATIKERQAAQLWTNKQCCSVSV
jgi:salicylate hydroxylase